MQEEGYGSPEVDGQQGGCCQRIGEEVQRELEGRPNF